MASRRDRTTEVIRHHWNRRAGTFDDEAGHGLVSDEQRREWQALLLRLTGPDPQRVLDIGCGTGFLALRFAELGHTVTGIDLAPQMIEQARKKAEQETLDVDFQVADAVSLEAPDATYSVVAARHVLWNLPDPDRAIEEWLRVLRPGGRLLLVEGKWADNEAAALSSGRRARNVLARLLDVVARAVPRGSRYPAGLLDKGYFRVELQLPFSGGPSPERLIEFLRSHALEAVEVELLMSPTLWGEAPKFPRYLAVGQRPA